MRRRAGSFVKGHSRTLAQKTAYTIGRMRIAVNHLTFAEPIPASVIESAQDAVRAVVEAGGLDARLVKLDETHAILVLTFPDVETEERIKSEVGGPWMREHVVPLLAGPTERASGEVVAGSN
jgi:hypothetical protein